MDLSMLNMIADWKSVRLDCRIPSLLVVYQLVDLIYRKRNEHNSKHISMFLEKQTCISCILKQT